MIKIIRTSWDFRYDLMKQCLALNKYDDEDNDPLYGSTVCFRKVRKCTSHLEWHINSFGGVNSFPVLNVAKEKPRNFMITISNATDLIFQYGLKVKHITTPLPISLM